MISLRTLSFLSCFQILWAVCVAQTSNVSGKVVDEHGSVVRGVNVLIKGSPNGTVSDWDGQYNIQVPPGKSTLSFVLIGYKMLEKDLSIEGIVNYRLDVVLIKNKRKNRGKESSGELTQLTNP